MIEKAEAAEVTRDEILWRTPNKNEIKVYSTRLGLLKKKKSFIQHSTLYYDDVLSTFLNP